VVNSWLLTAKAPVHTQSIPCGIYVYFPTSIIPLLLYMHSCIITWGLGNGPITGSSFKGTYSLTLLQQQQKPNIITATVTLSTSCMQQKIATITGNFQAVLTTMRWMSDKSQGRSRKVMSAEPYFYILMLTIYTLPSV
jgi:hypothetical protein